MKRENLYEPFSVSFETMDAYLKEEHSNTFFEFVYILSGKGAKFINGCKFSYKEGDAFLLTPSDYYSFEIEIATQFFFLRFNDDYLKDRIVFTENIHSLPAVLQEARHLPGFVLENKQDNEFVRVSAQTIRESRNDTIYYKELIQQSVNTMIFIIARNIIQFSPLKIARDTDDKAIDILRYIQENIYYPEKILAKSVSKHFKISMPYLGRYFKKNTSETMQQYMIKYKIKLIENQLIFSDKRIKEVANDFGFSDLSHFNKFFRKEKGKNPTEFRKVFRKIQLS